MEGKKRLEQRTLLSALLGAVLWLTLSLGAAFEVLRRLGEYGSVVQLLIGLAIGVLGAASHAGLTAFRRFRALPWYGRALLNWLSSIAPFTALYLLFAFSDLGVRHSFSWLPAARFLLLFVGLPSLALAALVALAAGGVRPPDRGR